MPIKRAVRLEWEGEGLRFKGSGTEPVSPTITIDGDNELAPGPMQVLLLAAASCAGSDVVLIMQKMRQDLGTLTVEVTGTRRDVDPRRYMAIRFDFHASGSELDRTKLDRAVALSIEKYCSVVASLAPDIDVQYDVHVA